VTFPPPRGFLEDNYGRFSQETKSLIDLVVELLDRVDALEQQVRSLRKDLNE
jgi:hypothetical protein